MITKSRIKRFIEKITNTHIFRFLPRGLDLYSDIKNHLPCYSAKVIFDVGANTGQSAEKFVSWFPKSQIYCFEPVTSNFAKLKKNIGMANNLHCFQLAFGAARGKEKIYLEGPASMYSLAGNSAIAGAKFEIVEVETIDRFCVSEQIERISLLKIDTEGYDLAVLEGAQGLLDRGKIEMINIEAGMNPGNQRHVPMEKIKGFLESKGYLLFGVYEQVGEWPTGQPQLRRADLVFISQDLIKANRIT